MKQQQKWFKIAMNRIEKEIMKSKNKYSIQCEKKFNHNLFTNVIPPTKQMVIVLKIEMFIQ